MELYTETAKNVANAAPLIPNMGINSILRNTVKTVKITPNNKTTR
ncbi:MAG: hypothetical protein TRG1_3477 [Flavobacteriaceae bacterium FS1-H7996/R]|nr:MAG: hypothetical protein TRG1_3477 [Flavobacteriaceae bacterium FS1-H7996/R]